MVKALLFLLKVSLVVAAAVWLSAQPGQLEILWRGYLIETSAGFAVAVLLGFLGVYTLLYRIWRAFVSVPDSLRRYHAIRTREHGYEDVTAGFLAVAAGDKKMARRLADRATHRVPDAPLARLLSAQAAQLEGDAARARRIFTDLLDDKSSAFFGLRGLLQDSLAVGDYDGALSYIRKADGLQPKRGWIVKTLFDLETRNRSWSAAEAALKRGARLGVFSKEDVARHRQALLLARADDAFQSGDVVAAHKQAAKALDINPAFTPAAGRLARFYLHAGKRKAAIKTLLRGFAAHPHADLTAAWMRLQPETAKTVSVYDEGRAAYQWARRLYDACPGHSAGLSMLGVAAVGARQFSEARTLLTQAADYRALAALERAEHNDEAKARQWLEAANDAPPAPLWVCGCCGFAALDWSPLCRHCGVFNASKWDAPVHGHTVADAGEAGANAVPPLALPMRQM
ncbi:MAG: tetratricopeptide repeat protein [Alphaproteobacteria bacterium]|nr:tetratricopeptide repeat protein [Alphaproteobacteria bacterium]